MSKPKNDVPRMSRIKPSGLIPLMIDIEWLEHDLHEMELCTELGGQAAKRRYEALKKRVSDGLSGLKKPPSWGKELARRARWLARCRKAHKGKLAPTVCEVKTYEQLEGVLAYSIAGHDLYYATHDMEVCREVGGANAKKHYEVCAKTVKAIMHRDPPTFEEARRAYLEAEGLFRKLAKTAKHAGAAITHQEPIQENFDGSPCGGDGGFDPYGDR